MKARGVLLLVVLGAASCTSDGEEPTGGTAAPTLTPREEVFWTEGAELPTPRTEVSAAVIGSRVVVIGGLGADGEASSAVDAYDPAADSWTSLPDLPEALHHAPMVAAGSSLWVLGGYLDDGRATNAVWRLPEGGEAWVEGPSLPVARGAAATAVVDGEIHLVGGATAFLRGAQLTARHDALDPNGGEWRRLPDLPEPRDHLAAAGVGTDLYVLGGRRLSLDSNTARVDVFDVEAEEWSRAPDMPTPRGGFGAASWRGSIVTVGGEEPEGTIAPVEFFDPDEGAWGSFPDLPTPRHGLGVAGLRSQDLFVIGGGPEPGLTVSGANEILSEAAP